MKQYTLLDACIRHGATNNRLTRLACDLVGAAWDSQVSITDHDNGLTTIIGRCSLDNNHHHLIWSKIYIDQVDTNKKPCGVYLVEELKRRLLDSGWYRDGLKRAIKLNLIK
jgi:hypothetical protein